VTGAVLFYQWHDDRATVQVSFTEQEGTVQVNYYFFFFKAVQVSYC